MGPLFDGVEGPWPDGQEDQGDEDREELEELYEGCPRRDEDPEGYHPEWPPRQKVLYPFDWFL